jgi:hypothetical protein
MTQQVEMPADAPAPVNRDRQVQELIKLLVEAVLMLPDNEKRCVLDKAITPLFEALLTLNDVKEDPGIGWIWMTLIRAGYPDYARRLWPPRTISNEESAAGASGRDELREIPDVA